MQNMICIIVWHSFYAVEMEIKIPRKYEIMAGISFRLCEHVFSLTNINEFANYVTCNELRKAYYCSAQQFYRERCCQNVEKALHVLHKTSIPHKYVPIWRQIG